MAKKRTVRKQGSPKAKPEQFSIPAELVEHILLGPADDRRVLQDSPLLGDVWAAYALDPGVVQDVLITPHKNTTAAAVAAKIREQPTDKGKRAKIAYLQGIVGARLYFDEVLRTVVPLTQWWLSPKKLQGADTWTKSTGSRPEEAASTRPRPIPNSIAGDAENFTSPRTSASSPLTVLIYVDR